MSSSLKIIMDKPKLQICLQAHCTLRMTIKKLQDSRQQINSLNPEQPSEGGKGKYLNILGHLCTQMIYKVFFSGFHFCVSVINLVMLFYIICFIFFPHLFFHPLINCISSYHQMFMKEPFHFALMPSSSLDDGCHICTAVFYEAMNTFPLV